MERLLRLSLPNGCFSDVVASRSRTMSAIRAKHNGSTELKFRMGLVRSATTGWVLHADLPGKPDVYFPRAKLAIFLDGCFWHGCRKCGHIPKSNSMFWCTKIELNRRRDRRNNKELRRRGFVVVRVWEHSLQHGNLLQKILNKINALVKLRCQNGTEAQSVFRDLSTL